MTLPPSNVKPCASWLPTFSTIGTTSPTTSGSEFTAGSSVALEPSATVEQVDPFESTSIRDIVFGQTEAIEGESTVVLDA